MKELKLAIFESDLTKLKLLLNEVNATELNNGQIKELIKLSKEKGSVKLETILLMKFSSELESYSKNEKEKIIVNLIAELSEDIYCSGWNDKIEKELWDWGHGISKPYTIFNKRIIESDVKLAVDFGNKIGLWAEWNNEHDEPYAISINKWINKLNK